MEKDLAWETTKEIIVARISGQGEKIGYLNVDEATSTAQSFRAVYKELLKLAEEE